MSYGWGDNTKPAALFNGQLYVDNFGHVYQWLDTAWFRKDNFQFRQVASSFLSTLSMSTGAPEPWRNRDIMVQHFGLAFDKAFYEIHEFDTGQRFRVAQLTIAELMTYLNTHLATFGGQFTHNALLKVYEVVDPSLNQHRAHCFNSMYSSLRGRSKTFGSNTTGTSAGFENYYGAFYGTNLSVRLMEFFYGTTPGTTNNNAIWSPWNRRDPYSMSKLGFTMQLTYPRVCWNFDMSDWDIAPGGTHWVVSDGNVNKTPAVFSDRDSIGLSIERADELLTGLQVFQHHTKACVIHLVRNVEDSNRVAFMIKPLGITHMAVRMLPSTVDPSGSNYDLIAANQFHGGAKNMRLRKVAYENRAEDGIRFMVHDALKCRQPPNNEMSLDNRGVPTKIKFYLRHPVTGLRSDFFGTELEVVRRKGNAPLYFSETRRTG